MESTAQYWRPVWDALERYWQPVAGSAKVPVRGRARCIWRRRSRIADPMDGRRIFRMPNVGQAAGGSGTDAELCARGGATALADRDAPQDQVTRNRVQLQNRLECLLEEAHIKVSSLVSDLLGASARRMLQALADGETNPATLAGLARRRLRATPDQLCDALGACTDSIPSTGGFCGWCSKNSA